MHFIEAFNGTGRGLPHRKTQKHGPFRTPQSTQKTVVTLVLGFGLGAGGLDKTPSLPGGLGGPVGSGTFTFEFGYAGATYRAL